MLRTLIVENNVTFRQSFRDMLHQEFPSMEILETSNGEEALSQAEAFHPDLIFMDIKLPGENGLSLTKKIKAQYPHTIVIILTSYDLPEYREAAHQSKADSFITKDTPTRDIFKVIRSVVFGSV